MMLRSIAARCWRKVRPAYFEAWRVQRQHDDACARLRGELGRCTGDREMARLICDEQRSIHALQVPEEITQLLERVRQLRPRFLCEIGSAHGGTLALFAQVAAMDALLLAIDLGFTPAKQRSFPRLALRGQRIVCLKADSHDPATLAEVRRRLHGNRLDFLFIDGDHGYAGVKQDYEAFAPLVRSGGIVAFHDVNPDAFQRTGTRLVGDVGDVPRYWKEIKGSAPRCEELVHSAEQDGCGIGVLYKA